jgi:hypothetical protein
MQLNLIIREKRRRRRNNVLEIHLVKNFALSLCFMLRKTGF